MLVSDDDALPEVPPDVEELEEENNFVEEEQELEEQEEESPTVNATPTPGGR
jgi:hypothetical protein